MSIPTLVLKAVTEGQLIPLYNDEIINEYREVLSRKKFPFDHELIETGDKTCTVVSSKDHRAQELSDICNHLLDKVYQGSVIIIPFFLMNDRIVSLEVTVKGGIVATRNNQDVTFVFIVRHITFHST